MAKLLLKEPSNIVPRSLHIAAAVVNAATILGLKQVVITSGADGCHVTGSKHYRGDALDIRTKDMPNAEVKREFVKLVIQRLGEGYQGFLENEGTSNEHAHFEWDPK